MKLQPTAVMIEPDAWVLAVLAEEQPRFKRFALEDDTPSELRMRDWLDAHRVAVDRPVVLGLNGSACYAACLSTQGLGTRGRETALRYRLEANLPEDLERLTVRMIGLKDESALAVAAVTSVWRDAKQRLAGVGIEVGRVAPTALLAAAEGGARGGAVLVQTQPDRVELVEVNAEGRFTAWRHLPANAHTIREALNQSGSAVLSSKGLVKRLRVELPEIITSDGHVDSANGLYAATRYAGQLQEDHASPALDFAETAAAQDPRWRAWRPVAAAMLLLVWVGFGLTHFKAAQLERAADSAQDQLRTAYVARFPGETPPTPLLPRLRSQQNALGPDASDAGVDALRQAVETLTVLPAEGEYAIDSISISATSFRIGGEAESLAAVDRLVQSINRSPAAQARGGLNPPATQILPSGQLRFELSSSTRQASVGGNP